MDSAGFISYCLTQLGRSTRMSGTNDLMRNYTTQVIPISEARKQKLIQPGVLLLHVSAGDKAPSNIETASETAIMR